MPSDLVLKRDAFGYTVEFTIQNSDGTAKNLTGFTITLKVWIHGASSTKISAACTITDAANGKCQYTVAQGDFDKAEIYDGELVLTKTGIQEPTETFRVIVLEDSP